MTSIDYEKFQFITTVQTSLIAHILSSEESGYKNLHTGIGVTHIIEEAFYAAEKLPKHQSVNVSACQFITFNILKQKDNNEDYSWFIREP